VPSDDLSSIPDLQDKHRGVLIRELKITTFRALAQAERRDIQRAMRNLRPRPTLTLIAQWQDHARSRLSEATDQSDWHPFASFAVVFAGRQVDDGWQHRIEAERTEVEPEQEPRIWPGWDCGEICGWMREQVPPTVRPEAQAAGAAEPRDAETAEPRDAGAAEPQAGEAAEPAATPTQARETRERPELRIDRIAVIGPAAIGEVVAASPAVTTSQVGPGQTPRIEISVSGARGSQEIHAAARVLRRGEFGWNLQDPVVIKGATGVASFDLSPLPAGRHHLVLVAWAPDATATLAREELPDVTIPAR
jgi:hypothetical protein